LGREEPMPPKLISISGFSEIALEAEEIASFIDSTIFDLEPI
jgi:hypothetical protein